MENRMSCLPRVKKEKKRKRDQDPSALEQNGSCRESASALLQHASTSQPSDSFIAFHSYQRDRKTMTAGEEDGYAQSLHEEMSHSIASLLSSLGHISLSDSSSSMEALQQISEQLVILKQDQRCLGILQGIQWTELSSQIRAQTEQQMMELQSISYHRDASCHARASAEQSSTHLYTVARQEMPNDTIYDESQSHEPKLINAYLSGNIIEKSESSDTEFDFADSKNHTHNLNQLHLERKERLSLQQELEQITARKQQVAQRLMILQNRRLQLKGYLNSIQQSIEPLQQINFLSTTDYKV